MSWNLHDSFYFGLQIKIFLLSMICTAYACNTPFEYDAYLVVRDVKTHFATQKSPAAESQPLSKEPLKLPFKGPLRGPYISLGQSTVISSKESLQFPYQGPLRGPYMPLSSDSVASNFLRP